MKTLKSGTYFTWTAIIFLVIAGVHAYRAINNIKVVFGGSPIPVEFSWVAVVVALYLAWSGYNLSQK